MRIALCTCAPVDADVIARALLDAGAACVNILPAVRSLYVWEGKRCEDSESLLVVKFSAERAEAVAAAVHAAHPYALPEWVVLDVDPATSARYRAWVRGEAID
jgi:periplasmic divalent cation tolerance protein